ncbi:hypothetical protein PIB30_080390 [Stylosanthes scabra]|uniref:Uncharacterized protein n=1 Tax=Stylosanthes scabra TaxID=79078 RepID=A0ABU6STE3_9FABA|nr:hypothetical protein [Stylosanthes scabra]
MFDSFETVSLGREDTGPETEVQPEAEVQPEVGIVIGKEQQPEPIIVEMPLQPDQPSKPQCSEVDDPEHMKIEMPLQPDQPSTPQCTEVEDPVPINIEIPLETQEQCSLTLRPWLQPEAGTSTTVQSPEAVIKNVLLSMNREESDNQEQQLGAQ